VCPKLEKLIALLFCKHDGDQNEFPKTKNWIALSFGDINIPLYFPDPNLSQQNNKAGDWWSRLMAVSTLMPSLLAISALALSCFLLTRSLLGNKNLSLQVKSCRCKSCSTLLSIKRRTIYVWCRHSFGGCVIPLRVSAAIFRNRFSYRTACSSIHSFQLDLQPLPKMPWVSFCRLPLAQPTKFFDQTDET